MNRRLHNTMTAGVAAGAMLLLALAVADPGAATQVRQAGAPQAHVGAIAQAVPSRGGPRRHRQRLVMPYFSFSRS